LEKLRSQKPEVRTRKDKKIKEKVLALPEFREAETVAFYVSFKSEVDTRALIDEALRTGKKVVVPETAGDGLEFYDIADRTGPYPKERIDLVVVPGVAFTRSGARLGRGKGFYDRFLKGLPGRTKKAGLAYDIQIRPDLPVTPRDVPVDIVITDAD